jgi:hypothetical protein
MRKAGGFKVKIMHDTGGKFGHALNMGTRWGAEKPYAAVTLVTCPPT